MRSETQDPGGDQAARVLYNDNFAHFYQRYCTQWTREFSPLLAAYLNGLAEEPTMLDLCCGTGAASEAFLAAGWKVIGVDLSRGMLRHASQRLSGYLQSGQLSLVAADATQFSLPASADACICLDGALNHLLSGGDVQAVFRAVRAALHPSGQFIFDLYQPPHFRHWHHLSIVDEPEAVIVKRGVWDDDEGLGMLRFSGAVRVDPDVVMIAQNLRSRTYSDAEIKPWLTAAGFVPQACETFVPPCPCGHKPPTECHHVYRALVAESAEQP